MSFRGVACGQFKFLLYPQVRVEFSQLKACYERGGVAGSPAFPPHVHSLGGVLHK
jgi:hypothetical protein